MFNDSILQLQPFRPWRWVNEEGGPIQEQQGVFILADDDVINGLAAALPPPDAGQLHAWEHRVTADEAGEWNIPVWAGETSAVFIRVPSGVWNAPEGAPPPQVVEYFGPLYQAD